MSAPVELPLQVSSRATRALKAVPVKGGQQSRAEYVLNEATEAIERHVRIFGRKWDADRPFRFAIFAAGEFSTPYMTKRKVRRFKASVRRLCG